MINVVNMSVSEKLVEIMENLGCNDEYCKDCEFCNDIDGCVHRRKEIIADRLIANGVTVQELDGCEHCRTASYTEKPFIVITQMGREVKTQFNFCPNCGRRLPKPPKGE